MPHKLVILFLLFCIVCKNSTITNSHTFADHLPELEESSSAEIADESLEMNTPGGSGTVETPKPDGDGPVFAVYYPDDFLLSPRTFFSSVKDVKNVVNSADARQKGARFKRFESGQEALRFLEAGDAPSPAPKPQPSGATIEEPKIPFSSVSRIEMNQFKKFVEKLDVDEFVSRVESNPRYLINSNSDTPAIVQEGFRYNILHIAAKIGATEIVEKILMYINDADFLLKLYGTNMDDVIFRRANIVTAYLNTPDKGNSDTPLHMACKFGNVGAVRALLSQPKTQRDLLNKSQMTAEQVICERVHGEEKAKKAAEIKQLFSASYVALYRNRDNSEPAKVLPPAQVINDTLPNVDKENAPLTSDFKLAAYAGPFKNTDTAFEFFKEWTRESRATRLTDADKGYERIGRSLAKKWNVEWAERWFFLNKIVDLASDKGLQLFESYLFGKRSASQLDLDLDSGRASPSLENLIKPLCFDDADDVTTTESAVDEETEDVFLDASEVFEDAQLQDHADISISDILGKLESLTLNSPAAQSQANNYNDEAGDMFQFPEKTSATAYEDEDFDMSDFDTPPSSPPPVFIMDQPTKVDNDLVAVLGKVPFEKLDQYPLVSAYVRSVQKEALDVREQWPGKDSPRCPKVRKSNILHRNGLGQSFTNRLRQFPDN